MVKEKKEIGFFKRGSTILIGVILGLFIVGGLLSDDDGEGVTVTQSQSGQPEAIKIILGDTFETRKFEIVVTNVTMRKSVGGDFLGSTASEGAVYVCIEWKYKNISTKPIGIFSMPSLKLIDADGNRFDPDIGASSSFATELNLNEKTFSDLNPQLTSNSAEVFELSEDIFDMGTWTILVDADKNVNVHFQ